MGVSCFISAIKLMNNNKISHIYSTFTVNPNTGTPKNPFKPSHTCGGSSGGASGIVSAGIIPVSIGSDGGGSIR
jgi:Asp-tRNA(Asn)/Glu-tRNA(Gln) amidotransferase A subunit family amidase